MTDSSDPVAGRFDRFKETYFEECAELLESAYAQLTQISEGSADGETMNAAFRAVHSIKGGAGAFGFDRLVGFAHQLETLLDSIRSGRVAATKDIAALLLRAVDTLNDLVDAARSGHERPAGFEEEMVGALRDAGDSSSSAGAPPAAAATANPAPSEGSGQTARYRIHFQPRSEMFQKANEPLLLIHALQRLGRISVEADTARLPDLVALEPECAYLGWRIEVETAAPRSALDEIFEFVIEDCDLVIEEAAAAPAARDGGEPPAAERAGAPMTPRLEQIVPAPPGSRADSTPGHSIRVDVEKIDRVVNLVGELVINQAMLSQLGNDLPTDYCPGLLNGLQTLSQHLRELQESVMAIRAQPVKSVFSRMPRLVREVAAQLGKEARLVVSGEATEIDKTVIEQLADPLTHLLRNALDHGIETPEEREARGKPRQGTIHLGAEHRSGRIVIEVADDGHGIDRKKILARAREKGIVQPGVSLSDEEIDEIIFLPSFSTAATVSNISGRGVGLDVVKRNMQALGGRISVESTLDGGSRFLLSLPLTLAVLDGMAVAVGAETYIIPLTNIVESLRPKPADIHPVVGRGDVLALRGVYVPLIPLHRRFRVPDAVVDPCRGIVVIVENESDGQVGLVVDELLGQQQVVVKSLDSNYDAVDGISGATILGNGRVALILDIARLHEGNALPARNARDTTGSAEPASSPAIH